MNFFPGREERRALRTPLKGPEMFRMGGQNTHEMWQTPNV